MGFPLNKLLCQRHNKKIIGNCAWCGKSLCKMCDFKEQGKRMYCTGCLDEVIKKTPRLREKYKNIASGTR